MAVSLDGDTVTLVADCESQPPVSGQKPRYLSTAGLTVLGTQDPREEAFEVQGSALRETEAGATESGEGKCQPPPSPGWGGVRGEGWACARVAVWAWSMESHRPWVTLVPRTCLFGDV